MKKLDDVSKKVEEVTKSAEKKVKETVLPKVKGLETMIVAVLLVMVLAGLVSGTGLMVVAGVVTAAVLGLPKYSKKVGDMIDKAMSKTKKEKTTKAKKKEDTKQEVEAEAKEVKEETDKKEE